MPHNHLKNRNNTNHCLFEESPTTVYVFWLCATPLLYADAQDTPAHPRSQLLCKPAFSSLIHFSNSEILQHGILRLISGSQAGGRKKRRRGTLHIRKTEGTKKTHKQSENKKMSGQLEIVKSIGQRAKGQWRTLQTMSTGRLATGEARNGCGN